MSVLIVFWLIKQCLLNTDFSTPQTRSTIAGDQGCGYTTMNGHQYDGQFKESSNLYLRSYSVRSRINSISCTFRNKKINKIIDFNWNSPLFEFNLHIHVINDARISIFSDSALTYEMFKCWKFHVRMYFCCFVCNWRDTFSIQVGTFYSKYCSWEL